MSQDIEEIREVLNRYESALNSASTEEAVSLFAADGIIMAPNSQTGVGTDAIQLVYERIFANVRFDVTIDIKEIVPTAPDWAFARTGLEGTTDVRGRGRGREANQELFILQKRAGEWRIARYCFASTAPPPR